MVTEKVMVTDKDGVQVPAEVVICPDCAAKTFVLFFADGVDHLHLQCLTCDNTFCSGHPGSDLSDGLVVQ